MNILNYNSTLHDIYNFEQPNGSPGFDPTGLCAVPTSAQENVALRIHSTAIGYNQSSLCVTNTLGHYPDFSGLHVRTRGSARYLNPHPAFTYILNIEGFLAATPPYTNNVHNLQRWNNGSPPFILVSSKYFTGCMHFVGSTNTANQTITLLGKDNLKYFVEGTYVTSPLLFARDTLVYKIIKVNGIPAPDGLTLTQQQQIKIYSIIDIKSFLQDPARRSEVLLWFQGNQGVFYSTILDNKSLDTPFDSAPSGDASFPNNGYGQHIGTLWNGDSGTPYLATWRGETYLVGSYAGSIKRLAGDPIGGNYQGGFDYITLNNACANTLLPVTGSPQYGTAAGFSGGTESKNYKSGFLEECEVNGLPFILGKPEKSPVMIKLTGNVPSNIYLKYSTISNVFPRFTCSAFDAITGQLLVSNSEFLGTASNSAAHEDYFGGYTHGFLALPAKDIYLTYVVPNKIIGNGSSTAEGVEFLLSPLCVDPEVGYVSLQANTATAGTPVYTTNQSSPIYFQSGYNYVLNEAEYNNNTSSISFNITPGAGLGKEPCSPDTGPTETLLRYLNKIPPDDRGDIKIQTSSSDCISIDNAYKLQALPYSGGDETWGLLSLNSHCAPCCRCKDYKNTSDYIKGAAIIHSNSVRDLNSLISTYNTLEARFRESVSNCVTAGKINPRFRLWPQQNFKLQIQAMAENNTKKNVRINKLHLTTTLTTQNAISAFDPESQTTYSMNANSPIACAPISSASYLYFKNLNPTPKGLLNTISNVGVVKFEADLQNAGSLPEGSSHPNDVEPCTGYSMITAGLLIVDPVFRKIVNLGYPITGVLVKVNLAFRYTGTKEGDDPCTSQAIALRNIGLPIDKVFTVGANKSSINPCDSVKASSVTIDDTGQFILKFPEPVHGVAQISRKYQILVDSPTGGSSWQTVYIDPLVIGTVGAPAAEFNLAAPNYSFASGAYQLKITYSAASGTFSTKCRAIDTQDDEIDIPASHFDVGVGFTI
jgi:hypothetical protein